MRTLLLLVLISAYSAASACLWDSDTLAMEAEGKLDIVDAITGRFPRNPPLYYEMRLERVSQELQTNPLKLENYDDAGVACDRLGRGKEAIEWMAKKRAALERLGTQASTEHWYRYFANLGTFEIHRWFREGAKKERIAEAKRARDHIAKAIEINPDVHFGREVVQLATMEWVLEIIQGTTPAGGTDYLSYKTGTLFQMPHQTMKDLRAKASKTAAGMAGLVVLGNAWESPDVFEALSKALGMAEDASLATLAALRETELLDTGKEALSHSIRYAREHSRKPETSSYVQSDDFQTIKENFTRLRKAADAWHEHRTAFMLERLKQGRHPDTDPEFWESYVEPKRPEISGGGVLSTLTRGDNLIKALFLVAISAIVLIPALIISRMRKQGRLMNRG